MTFEEVGDVFKLWNVVLPEAAVVDEERKNSVELPTSVCLVQRCQLLVNLSPVRVFVHLCVCVCVCACVCVCGKGGGGGGGGGKKRGMNFISS